MSGRRVLLIVEVCRSVITSSHHTFTSSHPILSSSHPHIFTSSHLHIFSCHLHIFASSHLHISSSHLHILTSSHLHIFTSHPLIFTSSHLHIFSHIFSHLLMSSSHFHIFTSCSRLAFLPSCPLFLFYISLFSCETVARDAPKSPFYRSFCRSNLPIERPQKIRLDNFLPNSSFLIS